MNPPRAVNVSAPKRILIDCTKTFYFGGNTGIQRVVRNLAHHASTAGEEHGVECLAIVWAGFGFYGAGKLTCQPRPLVAASLRARQYIASRFGKLAAWLRKVRSPAEEPLDDASDADAEARGSGRFVAAIRHVAACSLYGLFGLAAFPRAILFQPRIQFRPGDVLLTPDALWGSLMPHRVFTDTQRKGVQWGIVLHDLLPVEMKQTFEASHAQRFHNWLDQALTDVDFVIANSKATQIALRRFVDREWKGQRSRPLRTDHFFLGADLDRTTRHAVRPDVAQRVKTTMQKPTYLSVGTLEPRKDHATMIEAFEQVWARGHDVHLVFVGKIGWLSESLQRRIESHDEFGRRLLLWQHLNDAELAVAYRGAHAVISASRAEGFGLPIVEALKFNKIVLASDIPPHREAGLGCCAYFPAGSAARLAALVVQLQETGRLETTRSASDYTWPDWQQSTSELIGTTLAITAETVENPRRAEPIHRAA